MLLGTLGEHIGNMRNMANTNWELDGKPIGNNKNILLIINLLTLMLVDGLELFKFYILSNSSNQIVVYFKMGFVVSTKYWIGIKFCTYQFNIAIHLLRKI